MTRYDAVFWDIGGVIVELASIREGYAEFVSWLADEYDFDEETALEAWRTALGDYFTGRDGREYRTARDGYRVATESLFDADPPTEGEWRPAFERCLDETVRPVDGAVETVRALDGAGVHLGVVSDIDTVEADNMLSKFGVADCFDAVTTSEAVGYTKPDPRMFETALETWGGDPANGIMVGDRYEHDVAGAKDAGLDAVAFGDDAVGERADYVIDDLREVFDVVDVEDGTGHAGDGDPADGDPADGD
jgi:putative hydrolase of the HAD superfamily